MIHDQSQTRNNIQRSLRPLPCLQPSDRSYPADAQSGNHHEPFITVQCIRTAIAIFRNDQRQMIALTQSSCGHYDAVSFSFSAKNLLSQTAYIRLHKKPFISKELFVKMFSLCFFIAKGHQIRQRDMPADPPGNIDIPGIDLINHRTAKSKCWPIIIAYRQCPVPCVAGTKI